ncbi:hypothetical protein P872_01415 [Rhodonellum psychrophilum GCM71 = DSM 17998]|uniref:Uncharacterized protein n=1 Tax=Rhodonellum psychrophilum GCM71 = DSM 17998 TaxID=1123057 RepID=U5C4V3_9BACT|nr:hypothetical protein P872_01415 [Rhodonellum psychrophilum GCM71 = DSM 17998]
MNSPNIKKKIAPGFNLFVLNICKCIYFKTLNLMEN